jgi:hypothetical protein
MPQPKREDSIFGPYAEWRPPSSGSLIVTVRGRHSKSNSRLPLGLTFCIISLAIGLLALTMSPARSIGQYGLIQGLSPLYYVAIVALIMSFAWSLRAERSRSFLLAGHLTALVFLVHGAPAVIEGTARFQTAWLHAGFTNYVAGTGRLLPAFDARFSWPSFFTGMAILDRVAGIGSAQVFLLWWPVVLNLLYLPFIYRIANEFLRSEVKAWLAVALFPLVNWVGQDYFSPQSIAFLLYLAFIYVLVGPLGADDRPLWRPRDRPLDDRPVSVPAARAGGVAWPGRARPAATGTAFYLGILVLLMAAMATGHQLTPLMAVLSALVLAVAGRTQARGMIPVVALMAGGWICYGAVAFWSGHIGMLFGGFGNVQANIGTTVVRRVAGSASHQHVVDVRLLTAAVVWGLALLGAIAWRPRGDRTAVALLFIAAFGMILGGNYGGEGMLRVYLFSLPAAVCLIAALIASLPRLLHGQLALACGLVFLTPVFLVARWGNEMYEMTRPGELTAVNELYRIAPPGSSLVNMVPMITWEYADITKFQYRTVNLTALGPQTLSQISATAASNPKGGYVILTTGQEMYGWLAYGMPRGWEATLDGILSQSPDFRLRYSNSDAEIFQYVPPKKAKKLCIAMVPISM